MKAIIHTPTNTLENSVHFYETLGFKTISKNPLIVTDGIAVVEINPDRYARAGVKLYRSSWKDEIPALKKLTAVLETDDGYLLSDPNGVWIYLTEAEPDIDDSLQKQSFSVLGNFVGLCIESVDFSKSASLFEILEFEKQGGSYESGYAFFRGGDITLSLMKPHSCPHLFFNPSFTYFNGKNNLKVIENIRSLGIPITEEITHFNNEGIVDNIIIRDPGGYGFFIFND